MDPDCPSDPGVVCEEVPAAYVLRDRTTGEGRGTGRHGYPIFATETGGEAIGIVTSGSLGPTVGKNVGLGYVPIAHSEPGSRIFVDCRGKRVAAQLVKAPFYRRSAS